MRILLIGSQNAWRMESAVERAFRRAGHDTLLLDDRRTKRLIGRRLTQHWAIRHARKFEADFVFLSKCLALDPDTVAEIIRDRPNAMWYHDPQWHSEVHRPDIAHIAKIGKLARTFFVTGFVPEWSAHGLRAKFLPAAADASITSVPSNPLFKSDVAFIGTGYDPARAEFLLAVAKHVDVRVWGLGWEPWKDRLKWSGRAVEGTDFATVCSSSCVVLGVNPTRAAGGPTYTSDRTWMVMLAGGFLLTQYTPGLAAMLHDGVHCAFYHDVESCVTRAFHFIPNLRERQIIRKEGEQFVRAHHTYDQRIPFLLEDRKWVNPL